jgi:hypothetical protein
MIFLMSITILADFTYFLNRLPFLYWGRRIPNVRIFKNFIVLKITLIICFRPISTKPSISGSKVIIIGKPKAVIVLVNRVILIGWLFLLRFYNRTCIKVDPTQHTFDILHAIFLLYDLALKEPPVFNTFSWNIIQDDLLLDGIDDFFVFFDRLIVFTQISEISRVFEVLLYLL